MKTLLALFLLTASGFVLAFGSGGSLGGNPAVLTGGSNINTPVCLNKRGDAIPHTESTKLNRQCSITWVKVIDRINYDDFYNNKPKGETLADVRNKY
jgi:hypothetical protein